jgi:hypothetical protein
MKIELTDVDKRDLADFILELMQAAQHCGMSTDNLSPVNAVLYDVGLELADVDYAMGGLDVWIK